MKHIYDLHKIGERIKAERIAHGYTQEVLMNIIRDRWAEISRTSLYKIEHGQPCSALTLELLFVLCDVFGCEVGYLLCEEGYEHKTRKETDIVNATGLSPEAVSALIKWNAPSVIVNGSDEQEIRLKATENRLKAVSALIESRTFCDSASGYLFRPDTIETVYTNSTKEGGRFTHNPSFIALDNMQIDSAVIEQALLNTLNDSLKAIRNSLKAE